MSSLTEPKHEEEEDVSVSLEQPNAGVEARHGSEGTSQATAALDAPVASEGVASQEAEVSLRSIQDGMASEDTDNQTEDAVHEPEKKAGLDGDECDNGTPQQQREENIVLSQQPDKEIKRGLGRKKKVVASSTNAQRVRSVVTKRGLRRGPVTVVPASRNGLSRGFERNKFGSGPSVTEVDLSSSADASFGQEPQEEDEEEEEEKEDAPQVQPGASQYYEPDGAQLPSGEATEPTSAVTNPEEQVAPTNNDPSGPLLLTARLVPDDEDEDEENQTTSSVVFEARATHWKDYLFNRYVLTCTVIALLVLVITVLAVVLTITRNGNDEGSTTESPMSAQPTLLPSASPSSVPSTTPTAWSIYSMLPAYTRERLDRDHNQTSPQASALKWLDRHPLVGDMNDARRLQLFGMSTFFYATEGTAWNTIIDGQPNNWLDYQTHECLWDQSELDRGVCDAHDFLQRLNLKRVTRTGHIPPEISLLTSLELLELRSNNLNGTLPTQMSELSRLAYLDLLGNEVSGPISSLLPHLKNLAYVDLNGNELTGTIPTTIGQLSYLVHLSMTSNQLTGTTPSELGLLTELSVLQLSTNQLTGTIPDSISNLTLLKRFKAVENLLTGSIPEQLGALTQLTSLSLSRDLLSGTLPSELGLLTALKVLQLRYNQLSGTIPSEWAKLTRLKTLWLEENDPLSGSIPVELCDNPWGTSEYNLDGLHVDCSKVNCTCETACQCVEGED